MKQPNGLCIGNIVFFFVFSPALARRRHLPKHKLCDLLSAYSAPDFNDGNMYLLGLLPHMQKFLSTLWILYFRIPDNTLCLLNPGGQILPTTPPPPCSRSHWLGDMGLTPWGATKTPVQDDYPRYHFGSSFQEEFINFALTTIFRQYSQEHLKTRTYAKMLCGRIGGRGGGGEQTGYTMGDSKITHANVFTYPQHVNFVWSCISFN